MVARRRVLAQLVLPWLLLVGACTTPPVDGALLEGDAELYATRVQPIVASRCAFASCHGRDGMPLTLYAVGYLRRQDPTGEPTEVIEHQLTETELEHNRRALASRAGPQDPGGSVLIRRMLPLDAGGIPHGDVVVYGSEDDPELVVLKEFLRTTHAR